MEDISGFGLRVVVTASTTFPAGFEVSQFADDTDPFDFPELTIADTGMGLNGDMVTWAKAVPIDIRMGVIPNGPDDTNLAILFEANRVSKGKAGARDVITLTAVYPDGSVKIFSPGRVITGVPANGVQTSGRYKSKTYSFRFENQAGS